jgi:O-methyltransferase
MLTTLFFIRKTKALFIKFGLHVLVRPFENILLNLVYLSKLSYWHSTQPKVAFNDFYTANFHGNNRFKLYDHIMQNFGLKTRITYLEFGVREGSTFKWWVANNTDTGSIFHGFDTFEGLPEDWNNYKAGQMSVEGKFPDITDPRIHFYKGLFQDTLWNFLKQYNNVEKKVIHVDCDLYTSSLFVVTSLAPLLKKGDIIIFDEFGVPQHEFLVYDEFVRSFRIPLRMIGACNNYLHVAFIVE